MNHQKNINMEEILVNTCRIDLDDMSREIIHKMCVPVVKQFNEKGFIMGDFSVGLLDFSDGSIVSQPFKWFTINKN